MSARMLLNSRVEKSSGPEKRTEEASTRDRIVPILLVINVKIFDWLRLYTKNTLIITIVTRVETSETNSTVLMRCL